TAHGLGLLQPADVVLPPHFPYLHGQARTHLAGGLLPKTEAGPHPKLMTEWLDDNRQSPDDLDGHAVSHLGWGLNPQARWYDIALHGDEPDRHHAGARAFAGNFLFSTGPVTQGGGNRATKGHYDVPMRDCTVMLDGDVIIERGRVVDPKMIVPRVAR